MVGVTYHCPRCGAVAELERDAYLEDKCVTAEPLEGWEYEDAYEDCEARRASEDASGEREASSGTRSLDASGDVRNREPSDPRAFEDADGVVIVCGAAETDGEGCGEPYYLSFVRFEEGEEVQPGLASDDPNFDFLR